jgi:hypothetical protein
VSTLFISGRNRRWSGPYAKPTEHVDSKSSRDIINASSATAAVGSIRDETTTSYRQPKPLIITPTNTANTNSTITNTNTPQELPHLNTSSPTSLRKIHQRRRQILFGKNTAGYTAYISQIPKEKRIKNSMIHPATPDHTLDISHKRWGGLVNAWRRALHSFDPPDCMLLNGSNKDEGIKLAPRPYMSRQEEEVEQAKANGLQVAFGGMGFGCEGSGFGVKIGQDEANDESVNKRKEEEVTEEEEAYRTSCVWNEEEGDAKFLEEEVGYDSDDDIL